MDRADALNRASEAIKRHGNGAEAVLRGQLREPRRATSHRVIALAIREVRRRLGVVPEVII